MSSIDIISRALIKIGQPPIASITQQPYGESCGILYNDLLEMLLSSYYWRFAIKRAILAPDPKAPSFGYKYAYQLPSDFLCLMQFGEYYHQGNLSDNIIKSDVRYDIEGDRILTDVPDKLYVRYVARQTDDVKFSRLFREALICKLAAELAPRIKQSQQIKQQCDQEFESIISQAMLNNEIQRDIETLPDGTWVSVRGVWTDGGY